MTKLKLTTALTLLLTSLSLNANTIEVTHLNEYLKCSMIGTELEPTQDTFEFKDLKGTYIGYNVKGGFPVVRLLIPNEKQITNIYISKSPNIKQTKHGCLISFFITSPENYSFFEPSKDHKFHAQAKHIPAQLSKIEN